MNANVKEINELTFFKEEDDCSLLDEKNTEPILKSAEQNTEPTLMEMEERIKSAVPLFKIVTSLEGMFPTDTLPKSSELGETERIPSGMKSDI